MLRIILKKRLFANVYLTKKDDLRFFDDYFFNSKIITLKRQTIAQNKINYNDDSIIIVLNVF